MSRTHTSHSFTALSLALVTGALATFSLVGMAPAHAIDPQVVSLGQCAVDGGATTVEAGVPVSLRLLAFAQGTYGLMVDFLHKERTVLTVSDAGGSTQRDLTGTWAAPQQLDAHFWLTRPANVDLGTLAAGASVLVTEQVTFDRPLLVAYPPVGPSGDNGPYLTHAEDPFSCLITAE